MKHDDYKKYEGRLICNRCKEFIPQIKIRRASRKADKKRNSICQKCGIEGTQFGELFKAAYIKRTYLIPTFLAWCVHWYFFLYAIIEEGLTYETSHNSFSGALHSVLVPIGTVYLILQISYVYDQRRDRRTIREALKKN